ncbi:hypothetical protein [Nonomuraea sp. 10N515B]|uniref:hypothetical protein n=1 Tax=Nonomuraea sp. 10N515B TaxID=3457422 RepID=UPI003FCEB5BE
MAPTSVLNGAFLEILNMPFYNWVDWESGTFSYWGDGDQPVARPGGDVEYPVAGR